MSERSNTNVKFGAGYDVPWDTVYGTVEERRQQIIEGAGLKDTGQTLYEVAVEASLVAHALTKAAKVAKVPTVKKAPAKQAPAKQEPAKDPSDEVVDGGEAKSKAPVKRRSPAKAKSKDPIADAISKAKDVDGLHKVFTEHGDDITDQHKELARKRHEELSAK